MSNERVVAMANERVDLKTMIRKVRALFADGYVSCWIELLVMILLLSSGNRNHHQQPG